MPAWREGGDGYVGIFIFEPFVPTYGQTRVADCAETIYSTETMAALLNYTSAAASQGNQILDRRMSLQIDHKRCDHAVVHTYVPDSVTAMASYYNRAPSSAQDNTARSIGVESTP